MCTHPADPIKTCPRINSLPVTTGLFRQWIPPFVPRRGLCVSRTVSRAGSRGPRFARPGRRRSPPDTAKEALHLRMTAVLAHEAARPVEDRMASHQLIPAMSRVNSRPFPGSRATASSGDGRGATPVPGSSKDRSPVGPGPRSFRTLFGHMPAWRPRREVGADAREHASRGAGRYRTPALARVATACRAHGLGDLRVRRTAASRNASVPPAPAGPDQRDAALESAVGAASREETAADWRTSLPAGAVPEHAARSAKQRDPRHLVLHQ